MNLVKKDYENIIFLTFDIDWASDEVLEDTIELVERTGIKATFFTTHETSMLDRLRNNHLVELGVHPNFQPLFVDKETSIDVQNVLTTMRHIVPEAQSIRCHCLIQSAPLLDLFTLYGFTHDANQFVPFHSEINLYPYYHWNKKLIRVPYFWEDNIHCIDLSRGLVKNWDVDVFLNYAGLKVFDFHPIHLFLNTEDIKRYEETRPFHSQISELKKHRFLNDNEGTRAFFYKLVDEAKKRGMEFCSIHEVQI